MDLGVKYGKCMCSMDPEFKERMVSGGGSFWRSFVKGMKKGAQMAMPVVAVTNPELAPAVMAGEAALSQQQGGGIIQNLVKESEKELKKRGYKIPKPAAKFAKGGGVSSLRENYLRESGVLDRVPGMERGGGKTEKKKRGRKKKGGGVATMSAEEIEKIISKYR